MKFIYIFLSLTILAGCNVSAPIKPVSYDGVVTAQSEFTAIVSHKSGVIGASNREMTIAAGGAFVPISGSSYDYMNFGLEDQSLFTGYFKSELNRLGIVSAPAPEDTSDIDILVNFVSTHHDPNSNVYTMNVQLTIDQAGASVTTAHDVSSDRGLFSSIAKSKTNVGNKLLSLLLQDVQAYLSSEK